MADKDNKQHSTAENDATAKKQYTPYPDGVNDAPPDHENKTPDKEKFNPLRALAALFGFELN